MKYICLYMYCKLDMLFIELASNSFNLYEYIYK
jgi:hypothetical protein